MKLLLDNGAQAGAWDAKRKATPIHCAANKGKLACLKLLISHGADVNAGLTTRSPLLCAVQSLAIDCVRELLENGAIPHSPQVIKVVLCKDKDATVSLKLVNKQIKILIYYSDRYVDHPIYKIIVMQLE